jgi:hypothetical protein
MSRVVNVTFLPVFFQSLRAGSAPSLVPEKVLVETT